MVADSIVSQDAASVWQAASVNGELLDAHRLLLAQLLELSRDRVAFYSASESERRDYKHRWYFGLRFTCCRKLGIKQT
jgi:hypothetical protein